LESLAGIVGIRTTVNRFTGVTQIRHFVMAITVAAHRDALPGAFRGLRERRPRTRFA
jgi:hypothetical protein